MNTLTIRSKRHAWIELLRPPNLFTVPGDPLAGFFLATATSRGTTPLYHHAAIAAVVALLLYMAGLISNDTADYEEDRRDRPARPLPSARISRTAARVTATLLVFLAMTLAAAAGWPHFFVAAVTVQLAIMLYNGWLKHFTIPGACAMGACRSGSFLLGAVAAGWRPTSHFDAVASVAIGLLIYIAGVTWIADRETVAEHIGPRRWLPVCAVLLIFIDYIRRAGFAVVWYIFFHDVRHASVYIIFLLIVICALAWSIWQGLCLRGTPSGKTLSNAIGNLIRGLLLIQAACCALSGWPGIAVAAGLIALWPFSALTGRRFHAT